MALALLVLGVGLIASTKVDYADRTSPKPPPSVAVDPEALARYHDLEGVVHSELVGLLKECPTCVPYITTGTQLTGTAQQDVAIVLVWYPGADNLIVRSRKEGVDITFLFLPNGDPDPSLKMFLSHPPEVK